MRYRYVLLRYFHCILILKMESLIEAYYPEMMIINSYLLQFTFNRIQSLTFPRFGSFRTGTSVSMTDSSGKPYAGSSNGHGSIVSMNTTVTSVSNGSTFDGSVQRSPLRSSLKKPRSRDGLGIQNPGYSGSSQSPHMNRNGSVKKVRIQTHSTEV